MLTHSANLFIQVKIHKIIYDSVSGIQICCNKYGINIFAQSLYEENDDIVQAIMQMKHDKKGNQIDRTFLNMILNVLFLELQGEY